MKGNTGDPCSILVSVRTGAMLNNVPHIVDSVLVFRERLVENIGKGMFSLDEFTTKLTMEVMLKITL